MAEATAEEQLYDETDQPDLSLCTCPLSICVCVRYIGFAFGRSFREEGAAPLSGNEGGFLPF
jgi:hypothetical protein